MHPDQFFQNNSTDKVCRTTSRIAAVVGAYKMILPLFKVVGGAVAHFCSTISAVDHTGKQTALARLCPAVTLLTDLLHLVKDLLLNDRRVGVVENSLLFNGRFPLLFVPDGICLLYTSGSGVGRAAPAVAEGQHEWGEGRTRIESKTPGQNGRGS